MSELINKHGVKVREYRTSHWGHWDKDDVCASIISCGVCEEMKEIATKELGK